MTRAAVGYTLSDRATIWAGQFDTPAGGQSGFDQNRAFAGLGWTFNKSFQAEAGYLINIWMMQHMPIIPCTT
ncbi:MAG: DUF2490 domain-containing protein [Methylococcales bacterium]|nr:DUF2490 domain-containing protein [Methylococcales bacterium]